VREPDRQIGVRFHQDARLLVVRATPKAIEVVRKVVAALNEPYQKGRSELLRDIPVP
jgi:hypothetical protein